MFGTKATDTAIATATVEKTMISDKSIEQEDKWGWETLE